MGVGYDSLLLTEIQNYYAGAKLTFSRSIQMKNISVPEKIIASIVVCTVIVGLCHVLYKYNNYTENHYHAIMQYPALPRTVQLQEEALMHTSDSDMIVRSVYFDNRTRNGHDRIGVFLVAIRVSIVQSKLVVACGVGRDVSINFIIRDLEENRLMRQWIYVKKKLPQFRYEEFILECYTVSMTNGSDAFVFYKNASDSLVYTATSEFPVVFPAPRVQPTSPGNYDFSVVTCTEAHNNKVAWLREFVRYQQTIGIDHVHINILDTFLNDGGLATLLKDSQVAESVTNGYVTMTVWKDILETSGKVYSYSAILRKLDCIYRFRGTYDYAFLLDSDDFFNPLIHGKHYLKDYVQNWCRGDKSAGSCYFNWYYYYPDDCGLKEGPAEDGNLTRLLKSYKRWNNNHFKSVHLISAVLDTGYHHANCKNCLLPGYRAVHIDPRKAFVAHLRKYAKSPNGC